METPLKNLFTDEVNLTNDSDIAAHIRNEISDWSNAISQHPITNFGEHIHISEIVFRPAYQFRLQVQYEKRDVIEKSRPFWGEDIPTARITRLESVDAYEMDLPIPPGFSTEQHFHDVWDSERVLDCEACAATGTIACTRCNGEGKFTCPKCGGHGSYQCRNCSGSGSVTDTTSFTEEVSTSVSPTGKQTVYEAIREKCNVCKGSGRNSCSDCSGHGFQTCKACDADGKAECPTCRRNRKVVAWFSVQHQLTSIRLHKLTHNAALLNNDIWQHFDPAGYEVREEPVFTRMDDKLPVSFEALLTGGRDTDEQPGRDTDEQPGRDTDEQPGRDTDEQPGRDTDVQYGPEYEQSPLTTGLTRTWHALKSEATRKMHEDGSRIVREQLIISQLVVYHVTYIFQDETFELLVYGRSNEIHAPVSPLQRVLDSYLKKGNELLSNRDLVLAGDYLNLVRKMKRVDDADRTAGEISGKIEEAGELTLKDYKTGFWIGALICLPIAALLLFRFANGPSFLLPVLNDLAQSRAWIQTVHPWAVSIAYLLLALFLVRTSVTHFFEDMYKTLRTHTRAGRILLGAIPTVTESAMFALVIVLLDLSGLSLLLSYAAYPVYMIGVWIL